MTRRIASLLAFILVAPVCVLPAAAADSGPSEDVHTIRWLEPIFHGAGMVIDAVAVDNDYALEQWHDKDGQRIDALVRDQLNQWLVAATIRIESHGAALLGRVCNAAGPTSEFLARMGLPSTLIQAAAVDLPLVASAHEPVASNSGLIKAGCAAESRERSATSIDPFMLLAFTEHTKLAVSFGKSDASGNVLDSDFKAMMPLGFEFRFEGTVAPGSGKPIHVQAGTTVDVSFPFTLSLHQKGVLVLDGARTIDDSSEIVFADDGTLVDNSFHFVLPSFSLRPGAKLRGRINLVNPDLGGDIYTVPNTQRTPGSKSK